MPTVVHNLYDADRGATLNSVNWYVHGVYSGRNRPDVYYVQQRSLVSSQWSMNSHNTLLSAENSVMFHDVRVCVWCAMAATRIT
jgi:hypothetical protein